MYVSSASPNCLEEIFDCAKAELRVRFAGNERPVAGEYLERFECLRENRDLAVSLIYEEFCLLEDAAELLCSRRSVNATLRGGDSLEVANKMSSRG